jgi:hypothetical protein
MLDEKALRTSEFRDGPAVRLADGQEWVFPRPRFRVFPVESPDGEITPGYRPTYGSAFDRMLEVFLGVETCTTGELFDMRFKAASDLLRRNYTLTTADLATLLFYEEGDPESEGRWKAIDAILVGAPPGKKPLPDGSDSPS